MLNHGVSTGGLFLLIGMLYERRHTRLISEYGGIAKTVPLLAIAFVIVTLSSIGLPSTNGFVGEFLILTGTFISQLPNGKLLAVIATTGVILGAIYMLKLVEKVFYGPIENEENRHIGDMSVREGFVLAPVIVMIFVMGLLPGPFLAPAKSSVDRLIGRFQAAEARLNLPSTVGTVATAISIPRAPLPPPPAAEGHGGEHGAPEAGAPTPSGEAH
jgi:NADH-quinone oxidoreductase subunit M